MKDKTNNLNTPKTANTEENSFPGYPLYPAGEDIYNQAREEHELDPEDITKRKESHKKDWAGNNEKEFKDDVSGGDLDIPGSELDDEQENIGSEDEENNHYSLGGDNHEELEEDKGE